MELTERELAKISAIKEALRARIIDALVLKNQLIWILEALTELNQTKKNGT